jgi:hypothetical protein
LNDPSGTEYTLLDEWNKWTAVSQQQFLSIITDTTKNEATITVEGISSETVSIYKVLFFYSGIFDNHQVIEFNLAKVHS